MKKQSSYYVHGFTLLELIVAMIIGAIMVTAFYWIYTYAVKQFMIYRQEQKDVATMILFKNALQNDINQCNYIITPDEKTYYFVYKTDTVAYDLYQTPRIKKNSITDSFAMIINQIKPEYIQLIRGTKVVKAINLSVSQPYEIKDVVFTKYYSSEQLMNIPQ